MRRAIVALWLAAALLLAGCGGIEQSGVRPGDGPAAEETEFHGPVEEPGDEPSKEPSSRQDNAKFGEKYVYSDGLELRRSGSATADSPPRRSSTPTTSSGETRTPCLPYV